MYVQVGQYRNQNPFRDTGYDLLPWLDQRILTQKNSHFTGTIQSGNDVGMRLLTQAVTLQVTVLYIILSTC